jgi:hypothetical protein
MADIHVRLTTNERINTPSKHNTIAAPLGNEKTNDRVNPAITHTKAITIDKRVV